MTNLNVNIQVEVVYAGGAAQFSEIVCIPFGRALKEITVREVVLASGFGTDVLLECQEVLDWENRVGIFGECVSPDTIVKNGDRIEIYRDLKCDPKTTRRQRAAEVVRALARERSKPKPKKKKFY